MGLRHPLREVKRETAQTTICKLRVTLSKEVPESRKNFSSQGCSLAYTAGLSDPELVRGIICFGGWLDEEILTEEKLKLAGGVRVFIAHGNHDNVVEFEKGRQALARLEELGFDVTFYEFDGAHQVPEDACLAAQEWMLNPPVAAVDAPAGEEVAE